MTRLLILLIILRRESIALLYIHNIKTFFEPVARRLPWVMLSGLHGPGLLLQATVANDLSGNRVLSISVLRDDDAFSFGLRSFRASLKVTIVENYS